MSSNGWIVETIRVQAGDNVFVYGEGTSRRAHLVKTGDKEWLYEIKINGEVKFRRKFREIEEAPVCNACRSRCKCEQLSEQGRPT